MISLPAWMKARSLSDHIFSIFSCLTVKLERRPDHAPGMAVKIRCPDHFVGAGGPYIPAGRSAAGDALNGTRLFPNGGRTVFSKRPGAVSQEAPGAVVLFASLSIATRPFYRAAARAVRHVQTGQAQATVQPRLAMI